MEIFVYDERGRVDNNQDDDGETMIDYKLDVIRIEIKVLHQCMKTSLYQNKWNENIELYYCKDCNCPCAILLEILYSVSLSFEPRVILFLLYNETQILVYIELTFV